MDTPPKSQPKSEDLGNPSFSLFNSSRWQQSPPSPPASPHFDSAFSSIRPASQPSPASSPETPPSVQKVDVPVRQLKPNNPYFPSLAELERAEQRRAKQPKPIWTLPTRTLASTRREPAKPAKPASTETLPTSPLTGSRLRPLKIKLPPGRQREADDDGTVERMPESTCSSTPISIDAYNRGMHSHLVSDMERKTKTAP